MTIVSMAPIGAFPEFPVLAEKFPVPSKKFPVPGEKFPVPPCSGNLGASL
jgi:hypothetical protein